MAKAGLAMPDWLAERKCGSSVWHWRKRLRRLEKQRRRLEEWQCGVEGELRRTEAAIGRATEAIDSLVDSGKR
jgi:hypothetical protein